ncbi:MAG: heparinase II/III family protein [Rhodospirillales bacterium]|jgi:uncharacterized heparinase superfamily protein|nr:heparinase II/III family protein [Rhodospirillales bacterium]MDP6882590.1 heparinase II/III family protein [Rhodospirillales bacterium]
MTPVLRTLRYLRPVQVGRRLGRRALAPWYASSLYDRWCLAPDGEAAITAAPPRLWPGQAANGERIRDGQIRLIGRDHPFARPVDWQAREQSLLWRFTLHYFEWLADLREAQEGAVYARALIGEWMDAHPRPGGIAWHPYPLSLRVYAWLCHAPFVLEGADDAWRHRFVQSLDRQARHLGRVVERDIGGNHLIKNLKALAAAGRCLAGRAELGAAALKALAGAVAGQVPADGCHYERSPAYHLQVLGDLIDLRALLTETDGTPPWLDDAIGRMALALAFFRLGDGGLALFNDGDIGDPARLASLDKLVGDPPKAPESLGQAGYHRLAAGDAVAVVDTGRCCPDALPAHAHADTLAFEFSVGVQRLVVNCGTYAYQDAAWRNRLRGTAAHSTVDIDGLDSAEVYGVFRLGRRPRDVDGRRRDDADEISVVGRHDGYRRLGLIHHRRLSLTRDGARLSGEDRVQRTKAGGNQRRMAARFHLHPDVRVALGAGGGLSLEAPGMGTWLFEAPGEAPRLDDSVYAPHFGEMHQSRQIVVEKPLAAGDTVLKWHFRRQPNS